MATRHGIGGAGRLTKINSVVRSESVRNIIRERRMLEHLNHPFLCNLRYSFQDIEYLSVVYPHQDPNVGEWRLMTC